MSAFRRAGYAVVGTSRSIPASDEADFLTVQGDITEVDTARRVMAQALDRFGRIDSLINNAGIYIGKPFIDYTLEDYAAITAVNLTGFFHITQLAIGHMVTQRGGHVVNISTSLVDHADSKRPAALAALTKGGLVAVTRSLAIEYASRGVRVNAVALGVIQTPMHDPASYEGMAALHPLGRVGRDQRCRRRDPVSRAGHVRHRRDAAHRRRSGGRALTIRHLGRRQPRHLVGELGDESIELTQSPVDNAIAVGGARSISSEPRISSKLGEDRDASQQRWCRP